MSVVAIQDIARQFDLNIWIVQSWYENLKFKNTDIAISFFRENKELINAQPFVKWV